MLSQHVPSRGKNYARQNGLWDLFATCFTSTGPSLLEKTPLEHVADASKLRAHVPHLSEKHFAHIPPGHIKIRFWMSLLDLHEDDMNPKLEAILPLEDDGGFDLGRPIDPMRWTVFEPSAGLVGVLSPFTVHILSEFYDSLNVIEPFVSDSTWRTRHARFKAQTYLASVSSQADVVMDYVQAYGQRTKFVEWYDQAQQDMRCAEWRFKQWWAELVPRQKALLGLISIAFVVLCFILISLPRVKDAEDNTVF
ncbi:hypothetical protein DXG03_008863 [Asterophora parasitica]|uniref:Uncharacterized protein n=1 Tax=Asterophora parasitica TaxID=117018 RepID=A0A9P7GBF1_9AGAR|nr:hypothetical protein DXG03_008863 [Asterophora parasitica]